MIRKLMPLPILATLRNNYALVMSWRKEESSTTTRSMVMVDSRTMLSRSDNFSSNWLETMSCFGNTLDGIIETSE